MNAKSREVKEPQTIRSNPPKALPPEDWSIFLDNFSVEHRQQATSIQVLQRGRDSRLAALDLPLQWAAIEFAPDGAFLSIMVGKNGMQKRVHTIPHIARITVLNGNELAIEAADCSRTFVRCRVLDRNGTHPRKPRTSAELAAAA